MSDERRFVSRAGLKLEHALATFAMDVNDQACADFGCNVGGFTDCLLQRGAAKVFAIDTGYGVLDWKLRNDPRVIVMERTNAMHVTLPMKVALVVIDVAWTKQRIVLPAAEKVLDDGGQIITLIKPHYEAPPALLRKGVLPDADRPAVVEDVCQQIRSLGFDIAGIVESPIKGSKGNVELLAWLRRSRSAG